MNLNIYTPINQTGYGLSSLNIIKQLSLTNQISYFPLGNPSVSDKSEYDLITELYNNSRSFDVNAPCLKIWHQFDLANHIGKGPYFAMSFFELDTFNNLEKLHMSVPDHIFVTSYWAQTILCHNDIRTPSTIIPLGVDSSIFNTESPIDYYDFRDKSKYIFMNIGKWEIRKGHDILLELFNNAFPYQEDVELWILASENTNSYSSEEELKQWKNMYNSPRIKLFNGLNNHKDIAQFIYQSDCCIYPSRAEGWNLELLESMAMNKPVITTNYSAHTEFCNSDNSYLVDISDTEPAFDGKAFKNQGNWAKISQKEKDNFIDQMRYVYTNRINTNPHGIKTAKNFSWANTASLITRCIKEYGDNIYANA